jgi:hypothetical protein
VNRAGAALAAVLFIMAMAAALVVGAAYTARSAVASVRLGSRAGDTEAYTERALMAVIANWDTTARRGQPIGSSVQLLESGVPVRITRLGAGLYLAMGEAQQDFPHPLRRRMAVLIREDSTGAAPLADRGWALLP